MGAIMRSVASQFAVIVALALVPARPAPACTCEAREPSRQFDDADLVVEGVAYESLAAADRALDAHTAYRFRISKIDKAPAGVEQSMRVSVLNASWCPAFFTLGTPTRLFARWDPKRDRYFTSMCSGTRPIRGHQRQLNSRCEHPHTGAAALALTTAAFSGIVIAAYTNDSEREVPFHYKVFVQKAWKGVTAGQVVLLESMPSRFVPAGNDYAGFFARRRGSMLVHDECLRPEPAVVPRDYERRMRAYYPIEDELEKAILSQVDSASRAADIEYASTPSGELNASVFEGIGRMFASASSSQEARSTAPVSAAPSAASLARRHGVATPKDRFEPSSAAESRSKPVRTSCARCSQLGHGESHPSVTLLSCLALAVLLIRRIH